MKFGESIATGTIRRGGDIMGGPPRSGSTLDKFQVSTILKISYGDLQWHGELRNVGNLDLWGGDPERLGTRVYEARVSRTDHT